MATVIVKRKKATKPSTRSNAGAGNVTRGSKAKPKSDEEGVTEAKLMELVPSGLVASFVKQKLHDKRLEIAGLTPPANWDGTMPEVPNDIAGVDHDELANLLAQFSNAQSTALWHASTSYIESGFYDEIGDYLENVALLDTDQSNDTKRKAEAATNEGVMAARTLHRDAYSDYVRFRDFAKTCELRWRTVSRVGGFVGDEAEGEEAKASKSSTRGKASGTGKGGSRGVVRRTAKR